MGGNPSDLSSHSNSEALPEDRYIQIKQMWTFLQILKLNLLLANIMCFWNTPLVRPGEHSLSVTLPGNTNTQQRTLRTQRARTYPRLRYRQWPQTLWRDSRWPHPCPPRVFSCFKNTLIGCKWLGWSSVGPGSPRSPAQTHPGPIHTQVTNVCEQTCPWPR